MALQTLPPLSWTCPMHPEVVDDTPGACPICRMPLTPVRLDSIWTCPVHAVIAEHGPGRCRICGRDLVQVTMAVTWRCADRPDVDRLEPGRCADGSAAIVKYTARPHGNHNPQHGGQFFMAGDNWHHVEGATASSGAFRLFVYDDYSKPISPEQLARVAARVSTPGGDVPLKIAGDPGLLEAPIAREMTAVTVKIRFTPGAPEYRFDFVPQQMPGATVPGAKVLVPGSGAGFANPVAVPGSSDVQQLRERWREIGAIVDRGAFGELYVPALAAKDLAIAIADRLRGDPSAQRALVEGAAARVVRAAWMLDAAGDAGDRDQVRDAYAHFSAAIDQLEAAARSARR